MCIAWPAFNLHYFFSVVVDGVVPSAWACADFVAISPRYFQWDYQDINCISKEKVSIFIDIEMPTCWHRDSHVPAPHGLEID